MIALLNESREAFPFNYHLTLAFDTGKALGMPTPEDSKQLFLHGPTTFVSPAYEV
jgi:hypothetical protein